MTSSPGKIRPEKWKQKCLLLHNHQNYSLTAHSLRMHHLGGSDHIWKISTFGFLSLQSELPDPPRILTATAVLKSMTEAKDFGLPIPRTESSEDLAALQPRLWDLRNTAVAPSTCQHLSATVLLKPLHVTWCLLASEHVHGVHSLTFFTP